MHILPLLFMANISKSPVDVDIRVFSFGVSGDGWREVSVQEGRGCC